jgi:hypothetical protein
MTVSFISEFSVVVIMYVAAQVYAVIALCNHLLLNSQNKVKEHHVVMYWS